MAEKKGFYFRLAAANIKRSREVYLPYYIAGSLISGTFFLILTMIFGNGLESVPAGVTTQLMFSFGAIVFALFAFMFILYINRFLVNRRRREFGLYGVLGMNRGNISRVLMWENAIVMTAAVATGMILGAVLGRLLFMILLAVIGADTGMSAGYTVPWIAVTGALGAFAVSFAATTVSNSIRIGLASTARLLKGDNEGDRGPRHPLPGAIIGVLLLGAAYAAAFVTAALDTPALSVTLFFPAVALVIIATFLLFSSGSIAFLRLLRKNKRIYYKLENFVSISGMFHRMRQNSRGLASICILSTMLLVTLAGTVTLYAGREALLRQAYPTDVGMYCEDIGIAETVLANAHEVAARHNAELVSPIDRVVAARDTDYSNGRATDLYAPDMSAVRELDGAVFIPNMLMMDIAGADADREAAAAEITADYYAMCLDYSFANNYFEGAAANNALCGGLLFLGCFFAILFLAVTVLIIYFKQITEGFEDRTQFEILQKVGMDERQIKRTVSRQILWVFFLPLAAALMHTFAASGMVSKMLELFSLYDSTLTLRCTAAVGAAFAIVYLIVYRQTARVYYRIVRSK